MNSSGIATLTVLPGAGTYVITAQFAGTTAAFAAVSGSKTVTVTGPAANPTFTSIAASGTAGNYTLMGTVGEFGLLASAPTGTVSFLNTTTSNQLVASATIDPTTLSSILTPAVPVPVADAGYVLTGDLNGDGFADLLTLVNGTVLVQLGSGNGIYGAATTYQFDPNANFVPAMVLGDVNNDGHPDLLIDDIQSGSIYILLGDGTGAFTVPTAGPQLIGSVHALSITLADLNHDGNLDFITANQSGGNIMVFLGNGDGSFQAGVSYAGGGAYPVGVAVTDFNHDGIPDLAVPNYDHSIGILLGDGDGTFQPARLLASPGQPEAYANSATASLRNNAVADLVVPTYTGFEVYLGNNDGTFAMPVQYSIPGGPSNLILADFNHDGKLDLITLTYDANNYGQVSVFPGNGDGTFGAEQDFPGGGLYSDNIAVADLNNDGMLDFAIANYANGNDGSVSILLGQQTVTATATGAYVTGTGPQNVDASYAADTAHAASVSSTIPLTPSAQAASATTLASSATSIAPGGSVTFTATIAPVPSSPTLGTVNFSSNGTLLATVNVIANGTATYTSTTLTPGLDAIVATYSGDAGLTTSSSTAVSLIVLTRTTTTLSAPVSGSYGQAFTLTATVAPTPSASPAGTVSFYAGATLLGTVTPNASGVASLAVTTLPPGANALTGIFSGNALNAGSTSPVFTYTVLQVPSATALTASRTTQLATMPLTFTAQVSSTLAGTLTGSVSFFDGTTLLGTAQVNSGGVATYTTSSLGDGSHSITAAYSGNVNYLASTSASTGTTVTVADVNLNLGGDQNQTVVPGAAVSYSFPLWPLVTPTFLYDVHLTATSLPPGATYTFSPATIPAGSASVPVTLTVQTAKGTSSLDIPSRPGQGRSSRGPDDARVWSTSSPGRSQILAEEAEGDA